jgi:hypothetical protein
MKMKTIKINKMKKTNTILFGSSDDLVELKGQIESDYINWTLAQRGIPFEFSDETKGTIVYDGDWLIKLEKQGNLFQELRKNVGDNGKHTDLAFKCTSYSDVLIMKDGILWVKINGKKI